MTYSHTLPIAIHRTIAPFHALHATQRILMRLRAFSSIHWLFEFSADSVLLLRLLYLLLHPMDGWSFGAPFSSPLTAPAHAGQGSKEF